MQKRPLSAGNHSKRGSLFFFSLAWLLVSRDADRGKNDPCHKVSLYYRPRYISACLLAFLMPSVDKSYYHHFQVAY
jgi:hypothetical protein